MKIVSGISVWLLIFLTYSFIGWFFEVTASLVLAKKWSNRGFLIGPLCPIYGFGAMILTMLLRRADNLVEVFFSFSSGKCRFGIYDELCDGKTLSSTLVGL